MIGLATRRLLTLTTAPSTHAVFRGQRNVSLGFHAPQKPREAKVQHPKPERASA